MNYHSVGWRDNNDGQGQAYRDATGPFPSHATRRVLAKLKAHEEIKRQTIACSECGEELPADAYTLQFGRCAKHADEEMKSQ